MIGDPISGRENVLSWSVDAVVQYPTILNFLCRLTLNTVPVHDEWNRSHLTHADLFDGSWPPLPLEPPLLTPIFSAPTPAAILGACGITGPAVETQQYDPTERRECGC